MVGSITLIFSLAVLAGIAIATTKRHGLSPAPFVFVTSTSILAGALFHLPESPLFVPSDGEWYTSKAAEFTQEIEEGGSVTNSLWPGKMMFPAILALLGITSIQMVLPIIILNASIAGTTILMAQRVMQVVYGATHIRTLTLFWTTSPAFYLFSSAPLRESIFWLGGVLMVLGLAQIVQELRSGIPTVVLGLAIQILIRPDLGSLIGGISIALFLLANVLFRPGLSQSTRLLLGGLAGVFMAGTLELFRFTRRSQPPLNVDAIRSELAESSVMTAFDSSLAIDSRISGIGLNQEILAVVRGLETLPRTVLGPFPWEMPLTVEFFVLSLASAHLVVGLILASMARKTENVLFATLALVVVAYFVIIGSLITNYGGLLRFKGFIVVLVAPFVAEKLKGITIPTSSRR